MAHFKASSVKNRSVVTNMAFPSPPGSAAHFIVSILLSKKDLAQLDLSNIELFSVHHSSLAQMVHGDPLTLPTACIYISHDVDLSSTDVAIPVLKSKAVVEAEEKTADYAALKEKPVSVDGLTLKLHFTQEMRESSQRTRQGDNRISTGFSDGVESKMTLASLAIGMGDMKENHKPVVQILSRSLSQVREEAKIDLNASPAAKFLFQVMPWELTPSAVSAAAAAPFVREDAPGNPKLSHASLPSAFPTLQLPPRLLIVPTNELQQKHFSDRDSPVNKVANPDTSNSSSTFSNPSDPVFVEERLKKNLQRLSPYIIADSPYRVLVATKNDLEIDGKAAVASLHLTTRLKKSFTERKWMHWMTGSSKKKNKSVPRSSSASLLGNLEDQAGENRIFDKKPEISLNSKIAAAMAAKKSNMQEDGETCEDEARHTLDIPPRTELVYPTRLAESAIPNRQRGGRQKKSKGFFMKFRRTSRFFVTIYKALKSSVIPRKSSRRKLLGDFKRQYQSLH